MSNMLTAALNNVSREREEPDQEESVEQSTPEANGSPTVVNHRNPQNHRPEEDWQDCQSSGSKTDSWGGGKDRPPSKQSNEFEEEITSERENLCLHFGIPQQSPLNPNIEQGSSASNTPAFRGTGSLSPSNPPSQAPTPPLLIAYKGNEHASSSMPASGRPLTNDLDKNDRNPPIFEDSNDTLMKDDETDEGNFSDSDLSETEIDQKYFQQTGRKRRKLFLPSRIDERPREPYTSSLVPRDLVETSNGVINKIVRVPLHKKMDLTKYSGASKLCPEFRYLKGKLDPSSILNYKIGQKVGEGSYGSVFQAKYANGETVAIKQLLNPSKRREGMPKAALRELEILALLPKHENIVEFKAIARTASSATNLLGTTWIIYEFLPMDLPGFIYARRFKLAHPFTLAESKKGILIFNFF